VHTKGFQILIGYMMGKYGVDATFPVRVSIAFEQTYEEIDGVETIEQGIELLTGVKAGVSGKGGKYPKGTINAKVIAALEGMAERLRGADRNGRAPRDGEKSVNVQESEGRDRDPREGPSTPPVPPAAKA
jgi:hypothetical protein